MPISGEFIFIRVFDMGGTFNLPRARKILGPMAAEGSVQTTKAAPDYVSFAAPIPLNLAPLNLELTLEDGGPVALSARLYEVGTLGLTLRFPLRGQSLSDLAQCDALQMSMKGKRVPRAQVFTAVHDALKDALKPAFDEIFEVPVKAESYTVYCLTDVPGGAERVFREERARISALLTGETQPERLAGSEVDYNLNTWVSYYRDDLVVADWDAAFVVEPSGQYEDLLYIFEVANLQLLALRKYDLYLDDTLERGYEEFERLSRGLPIFAGRAREMVRDLGAVRMDLAKVTDEVANTAKFFGDWYIARVYLGLAAKLHLHDYRKIVEEKLATLNDLYQSVLGEIHSRQNIVLEVMVVLLIVFEVVMALMGGHK